MLPEDTKQRRAAFLESLRQTNVTDHFMEAQPEERVPPYTDELFKEAAIQWLVETDQVSHYDLPQSSIRLVEYFIIIILAHFCLRSSSFPEDGFSYCSCHTRDQTP
jgi:hypothetical protein